MQINKETFFKDYISKKYGPFFYKEIYTLEEILKNEKKYFHYLNGFNNKVEASLYFHKKGLGIQNKNNKRNSVKLFSKKQAIIKDFSEKIIDEIEEQIKISKEDNFKNLLELYKIVHFPLKDNLYLLNCFIESCEEDYIFFLYNNLIKIYNLESKGVLFENKSDVFNLFLEKIPKKYLLNLYTVSNFKEDINISKKVLIMSLEDTEGLNKGIFEKLDIKIQRNSEIINILLNKNKGHLKELLNDLDIDLQKESTIIDEFIKRIKDNNICLFYKILNPKTQKNPEVVVAIFKRSSTTEILSLYKVIDSSIKKDLKVLEFILNKIENIIGFYNSLDLESKQDSEIIKLFIKYIPVNQFSKFLETVNLCSLKDFNLLKFIFMKSDKNNISEIYYNLSNEFQSNSEIINYVLNNSNKEEIPKIFYKLIMLNKEEEFLELGLKKNPEILKNFDKVAILNFLIDNEDNFKYLSFINNELKKDISFKNALISEFPNHKEDILKLD